MLRRPALCLTAVLLALPLLSLVAAPPAAQAQERYPVLRSNGSRATFAVDGGGRIRVDARAARCHGYPVLRLWIDGRLDRTIRMTQSRTHRYQSSRSYPEGKHRVVVILRRDKAVVRRGKVVCNRRARIIRVTAARPTRPPVENVGAGGFTIGVIGDTQGETTSGRTTFADRTRWLAANARALDLRFVAHTGDFTNWGWLRPGQYEVGRSAMETLSAAGIPWQVSAGNHDTRAVGWNGVPGSRVYGGAAYVGNPECVERLGSTECVSSLLVRETEEFAAGVPGNPHGGDETGHFDDAGAVSPENSYTTFEAEGTRWLMLNLELWPRPEVVAWAREVVGSHPQHHVIVQTHSYLSGGGAVEPTNGGYGSTSGTYLERNLIAAFPNIVMVLSGHAGTARHRVFDYGGHRVVAFLGNSGTAAVTRLVNIDVRTGTVISRYWTTSPNLSTTPTGRTVTTGFDFR